MSSFNSLYTIRVGCQSIVLLFTLDEASLNTTAWYYLVFYEHLQRKLLMVNTDNSFKCKYLISIHC